MIDLFGQVIGEDLPRKRSQGGYAAAPGSGPAGETCRTCAHFSHVWSGRYRKCELMARVWTRGPGTDIRAYAPACRFWEKLNMSLTDEQIERLRSSLNNAIHELVFACQHIDQGDIEDAEQCLTTAQGTIEQVGESLVRAER